MLSLINKYHKKILGLVKRPRIIISRSNRYFYIQIVIDKPSYKHLFGAKFAKNNIPLLVETIHNFLSSNNYDNAVFDRNGLHYKQNITKIVNGLRQNQINI